MIQNVPKPHPTLTPTPHLRVILEPPHTGWLDYMTAFGTVGAAVVAVIAALISLRQAKNARDQATKNLDTQIAAADAALQKQIEAAAAALQKQLSATESAQRAEHQASRERDAVERDADLLLELMRAIADYNGNMGSGERSGATERARVLLKAIPHDGRLQPVVELFFPHGGFSPTDATAAVAEEIARLPRGLGDSVERA